MMSYQHDDGPNIHGIHYVFDGGPSIPWKYYRQAGGSNISSTYFDKTSPERFWIYYRYDISHILKERELYFKKNFGERKSLHQLLNEHKKFFDEYLQKCISLHSTVEVRDLIKNIDDLIDENYKETWISNRKNIEEKLECIEITVDCSNRLLKAIDTPFITYDSSFRRVNSSFNNILPSAVQIQYKDSTKSEKIDVLLGHDRWIVILGDPGSGKTSLLRWITSIFAKAAYEGEEKKYFRKLYCIPIRIPILIRISEFVVWLDQHQSKTLIDFIGEHTWFSERYCDDTGGVILRELIDHGHALVLFDGLDEIPEVGRRIEIVELVKNFIDKYIRTPDFCSPFDKEMFSKPASLGPSVKIDLPRPCKSDGNQVIITSRIVGYELHSLTSDYIRHYSLLLMNHQEAKQFINQWMTDIEKCVVDVFRSEIKQWNEKLMSFALNKRRNAMINICEKGSELLMSNPGLLSLICTSIYKSNYAFQPKLRVEVYHYATELTIRSWISQRSDISEEMLLNILIDLANYLHMYSPSGLIDAYDMEHLCYRSLVHHHGKSNNQTKLRKHAKKLISLFDSNVGIVFERGLQIFGFLHLSFQEYFVSQFFVKISHIEEIVKRILSFVINPRFRESLLLSISWISWKRSFDDYNQFCNFLITPTENYLIPFGTLLFFDAIDDLYNLPLNSIIFIALNNILNHSSFVITRAYLIPNLLKLPTNIIEEWMKSSLKDEKRLIKFCYCLVDHTRKPDNKTIIIDSKPIPYIVYQQLWSLHDMSTSIEFLIDQILRKTLTSINEDNNIFNQEFVSFFLSNKLNSSNIHPLILSIITATCGGITFKNEENIRKIYFSPKQMHRQSSILSSIIDYFTNNNDNHSSKIQLLIKKYETILAKCNPENISTDIVDTFIALICLQGVSRPLLYKNYNEYQALPLALERLKWTWFHLTKSIEPVFLISNGSFFMESELKLLMKEFFLQFCQSDEERVTFSFACIAACNKIYIGRSDDWFKIPFFHSKNIIRYLEYQPEFSGDNNERKLAQMNENIHPLQILKNKSLFLLSFVPESLQQLYYCMMNNMDSFTIIILLSQCLILLENMSQYDSNIYLVLSILQPLFKQHNLENYALVLFYKDFCNPQIDSQNREKFFEAVKDHMSTEKLFLSQERDLIKLINIEQQRIIYQLENTIKSEERDLEIFSASISLARLLQAQYRSEEYDENRYFIKNKYLYFVLTDISNPMLYIIALSIIIDMKDPIIFHEEHRDELRYQMINKLQSVLPDLPLLTSTLLFVRCYGVRTFFTFIAFKKMAHIIGEKLNEPSIDKQIQEAVFIALKQLDNPDLLQYLSKFAKQTMNLSDLFHFNSTIFNQYFIKNTSFNSSNTILLTSMYLTELAFDAQILNIYNKNNQKNNISLLEELNQLWNESLKYNKIINFKTATWITKYLLILNKEQLQQVIKNVCSCIIIEKKALPVIEEWLNYRINEDLRFFAHYAALQLLIGGSNIPDLIDIIKEIFYIDRDLLFSYFFERLFNSQYVKLNTLRDIILALYQNIRYSLHPFITINHKDTLMLILRLEFERIVSNVFRTSDIPTRPYLLMFKGCSEDLQAYLAEHLCEFINTYNEINNSIKEEYVSTILKWIIENSIYHNTNRTCPIELSNYIFILLNDQRFSQIQKTIINAFNSFFTHPCPYFSTDNIFHQTAIINLEKIILFHDEYSKNLLSVSLLLYGNYLIWLRASKINQNISNEIQIVLNKLFNQSSSSEILSIRSAFCLISMQITNRKSDRILNWFKVNNWDITPEKTYNILLQQTLYAKNSFSSIYCDVKKIGEHINIHIDTLMATFVDEFYDYLCKKVNINYLSDPFPDYIKIVSELIYGNFDKLRNLVRKSHFSEEDFKRKLYDYHKNKQTDCLSIVRLYAEFGELTIELIEMLKLIEENEDQINGWLCLEKIKQVSNEEIIQKIFQRLVTVVYCTKTNRFSSVVKLLVQLAQNHVVSSLEVHQQISSISKRIPFDNNKLNDTKIVFDYLLNLSCIKNEVKKELNLKDEKIVFTENEMNELFQQQIDACKRKSTLFLRRNFFFDIVFN